MNLRVLFILYLVALHLVFGATVAYLLRANALLLLCVEVSVVLSVIIGGVLLRRLFQPLQMVAASAAALRERDFSSRLRPVGLRDMDALIDVYNTMLDQLREERLQTQEQSHLLANVIERSPSGIILFDFEGRVSLTNPSAERLVGNGRERFARENLIGTTLEDISKQLGGFDGKQATTDHATTDVVLLGMRRVRCVRLEFLDRGFSRTALILEEFTDELRRSEKAAYEQLIRTFVHEINNSMASVGSLLQSCLYYTPQLLGEDRADMEHALHVALTRTAHLVEFVKGYADIVRLPPSRLQPADVAVLLHDVVTLMGAELRRRSIQIEWQDELQVPSIRLDSVQMEQVFINIIKNAMEAIEAANTTETQSTVLNAASAGTITIRLARDFVAIEDTGCGISPNVRAQLFTPFFTTKENGQGLGLTLVREILSQHGFGWSLERSVSERTVFTIVFSSR